MTRHQFERFWSTSERCRVVMEGCSGSHSWARLRIGLGFEVKLIPPHYVTPYRRRNKTDRADFEAILEADRCAGIHGITVKSEAQQAILALHHRVRSQWMATRTARINAMRGLLRELGVVCALGAERFLTDLHPLLERNPGVKPFTSTCLRGRCSDWQPAREFHVGPEPRGSTPEAVYTTAARPLLCVRDALSRR